MDKLKMHSPNLVEQNIDKLATLFPNCVTESKDENGKLKQAIDFDLLKQELSRHIVDGPQERYQLNWPGKREALLTANAPIAKTLRPCREESVNFDTTRNLFIEGDNLDALKLLQETYLGKVKMIYIDPPYNTGNDFIYEDDFVEDIASYTVRSNQIDEQGNRLVANTESNGRFHSDWLSMMFPRIRLAKNLLREDGVLFISSDDVEVSNIRKLCDEIFGENNFIGTIVWKKKTNGNNVGSIPPVHDYITCYARKKEDNVIRGFKLSDEYLSSSYTNPDNDLNGPWTTSDLSANHVGPYFGIVNPNTGKEYFPPAGRYWVFNEDEVKKRISSGRIIFGKSGNAGPVQKKYLKERGSLRNKPDSWWDNHGLNSDGTTELSELFAPKVFSHPKPTTLIRHLIDISSEDSDLILDFFAGSGTTAHAVFLQNLEDGCKRKFICIQLNEKCDEKSVAYKHGFNNLAELCKERIKRAGHNLITTLEDNDKKKILDIGFRTLKIDTSNMSDIYYAPDAVNQDDLFDQVENVKSDRSEEDLLFQVMLDWGVDLTLPIRRETIADKKVFFVDAQPDNSHGALVACFDKTGGIDEDFIKQLAAFSPLRLVFRDAGFASDAAKTNAEQLLKQLSATTDVKTI
ncbi:site-specific DNA-methyltransferase [Citrobacter cronae]|uniref:site-specific DNA-methyltransferase n=1 Tax=Citrobacter cronae TaxID=1748967 RepID=UPI0023B32AF6|nr:site-specific DNA-methyltransferase [Citrobacter cronae]MDE9719606.1 site-specific DNA-methyltransferase [Citrobacter cronae]